MHGITMPVYIADIPITDNVYDCSQEIDLQFGIRWEGARKNSNATGVCPNGTGNIDHMGARS